MNPAQSSTERPATGVPRIAAGSPEVHPAALTVSAWHSMFGDVHSSDLKLAMAASGTVLSVFTVGHMTGNMQVYLGREHYNDYAEFIRSVGAPVLPRNSVLWVVRAGLLASTATHVLAGTELSLRSLRAEGRTVTAALQQITRRFTTLLKGAPARSAPGTGDPTTSRHGAATGAPFPGAFDPHTPRPRPRGRRRSVPRVIARSMRSTGAVLGLFTVYHVLDLTAGVRPAASVKHTHGDAYGNLVASLSRPSVAVFYTASMAALAGHMIHGLRTAAMDTGLTGTAQRVRQVDTIAKAVGGVVALGNVSIPAAVLSKVVR